MATKSRSRQNPKSTAETATDSFPLAEEVRTFDAHLAGWADREGQFVLIKGSDILGFYSSYDEALAAGYDRLGDGPFLVKQIILHEPVYQLGRIEP
jgi:hypothetical protein